MSHVIMRFETDNAAFRLDDGSLDVDAVAALISGAADRLCGSIQPGSSRTCNLRDVNGNSVGYISFEEDDQ